MCNSYNGYDNYPTWCVSLWIDNDEGLYNDIQNMAIETYNDATPETFSTQKQVATYKLESQLKDFMTEFNPVENESSMFSDLMGWVLDSVNWYELAENWIDNVIDENLVDIETVEDEQEYKDYESLLNR